MLKQLTMKILYGLAIFLTLISCNKNNEESPSFNVNGFLINNITANSIQIQYSINTPGVKETGIIFSRDSSLLVLHGSNLNKVKSSSVQGGQEFTCQITNLEMETRYWIQVYIMNSEDKISYLKPVTTSTIGYTLMLTPYFRRAVKGETIVLYGNNSDTVKNNYKIFYDTLNCQLGYFMPNGNGLYSSDFILPLTSPLGDHTVTVKYKGKNIFTNNIEVLKGAFYKLVQIPKLAGFSNTFSYNDEIYFYYGPGNFGYFWKWNPELGKFFQVSAPDISLELPQWEPGWEINGKIYFAPFTCNTAEYGAFCARSPNVEKFIYSYNPDLNLWEKNAMMNNDSIPPYAGLYSSFVYKNKLYCFAVHSEDGNNKHILLKAFDPEDSSWRTVIDSVPFNMAWGCKTAVINDKIYILASMLNSLVSNYNNELYSLDLETNTFIKKSIWSDSNVGSINPFFFAYKDHLFFYGGNHGWSSSPVSEDHSYEYSPETDIWTPLSSCFLPSVSYTTSALGGFLQNANDKIYMGLGWSNWRDGNEDMWGDIIYEYILE